MLDLTRPEVADWMERSIARVIEEEQLDFFRLDQNTGTTWSGASVERHGYLENAAWRYHDALYGVWDRIRERFPDVILENCAGGGGRTDIAMVQRFSHTDITDWQIGPGRSG